MKILVTEQQFEHIVKLISKNNVNEQVVKDEDEICSVLTCNKLNDVLGKIDQNKLTPEEKSKLSIIIKKYHQDVKNNLKDSPKSGGLKGMTGDSEKDFCDMYLSEIQTLICSPTQE